MTNTITVPYPTPYGKCTTAVCMPGSAEPDACYLGAEAAGLMAGIYDPHQLALFVSEFGKVAFTPEYLATRGGHPVPCVKLPSPKDKKGPSLALLADVVPVAQHYELVLGTSCWAERASELGSLIRYNLDRRTGAAECALALAALNTGAFEQLREKEIDCLEAAVYYLLTEHREWRSAASLWLKPFAETWLNDWLLDRSYVRFIARCLQANYDDDNLDILVQDHGR